MESAVIRIEPNGRHFVVGSTIAVSDIPAGTPVPGVPFFLRRWGLFLKALEGRMKQEDMPEWSIGYAEVQNTYFVYARYSPTNWDEYRVNFLIPNQTLPELDTILLNAAFSFRTLRLEIDNPLFAATLHKSELCILRARPLRAFQKEVYPILVGFSPRQVSDLVIERHFSGGLTVGPSDIVYIKMPPMPADCGPSLGEFVLTITLGAKKDLRLHL